MEGGGHSIDQLPELIKEWMSLEKRLQDISVELREKRKRSKALKSLITDIMRGNKVGTLNISAGAVTRRVRNTKAPLTKKYIVSALTDFFSGDTAMAEKCAAFLDEHRPMKSTENLTLEPR